jgi:3-(3-hydroxy-phenyl)propionate hydroxylase
MKSISPDYRKRRRNPRYSYRRSADQEAGREGREAPHHPLVIVGAGLVGLCAAVDLAMRGVPVLVLDDDDTVSVGSRAICFAKRSLEICDRLGVAGRMRAKGITWNRGKVFFRDKMVYEFNLLEEPGHGFPAFVNLQQYYAEAWLIERAGALGRSEIRWLNRVTGVARQGGRVRLEVDTPDGPYALTCDYLLAADGARSQVRRALGLDFKGRAFDERFLIADVVMQADLPTERRFWFDPPFHRDQSALLHRQADNVWRIDLQLGADADPELESRPERVVPRLKAMLGEAIEFELEWVSVYSFQCRRIERFRHGRVFFLGDSAHLVSPFGARGGNGGIQDADNLCWKLALVLAGLAPDALLDSYDEERIPAADENILNSSRSTDFITPKTAASRAFRDTVLELSEQHPFARAMVNSGRLSQPFVMADSSLNTADSVPFAGALVPGAPAADAPVRRGGEADWLLRHLGPDFTLLVFAGPDTAADPAWRGLERDEVPIRPLVVAAAATANAGPDRLVDRDGLAAARYDAAPGTCYLVRPDQHVAARFRGFDAAAVRAARDRALAAQRETVER